MSNELLEKLLKTKPITDHVETRRLVEDVKKVMFAWHPWYPHPNLGSDTFRFNIPYLTLPRLEPIKLEPFPRAEVLPRSSKTGFSVMSAMLGGDIPAMASGTEVKQVLQYPQESLSYLLTAYQATGMTALKSLGASEPEEELQNILLYEAVIGLRKPDLTLEAFPAFLSGPARENLHDVITKGVVVLGEKVKLPNSCRAQGEQLIAEIAESVERARVRCLDENDGLLIQTRKALNVAANGGQGGKTHLDKLDHWMMEQFPSFSMDTDVERSQKMLLAGLQQAGLGSDAGHSGGSAETNAALLAIFQQNQKIIEGQNQRIAELTAAVKGGKTPPSPPGA